MLTQYKCPACGASLHVDGVSGEAVCDYCGCRIDIQSGPNKNGYQGKMKYCRHCGASIPEKAVVCTKCGCQVEELRHEEPSSEPQVVINRHVHYYEKYRRPHVPEGANVRRKWVSLALCFFLGWMGAHKFYEGKTFWGIVYLLTGAFGGIGWLMDCFVLLFKPNPYYV